MTPVVRSALLRNAARRQSFALPGKPKEATNSAMSAIRSTFSQYVPMSAWKRTFFSASVRSNRGFLRSSP